MSEPTHVTSTSPATGATAPAAPAAPVAAPTPLAMPQRPAAAPEPAPSTQATPPGGQPQTTVPAEPKIAEPTTAQPSPPTDPNVPPAFTVPEEYKDRPWAAKIKSEADLYKQLDNLDKLAGKKALPPNLAEATPEEREAFYAQMRPASADAYVFPDTGIPMPPEMKTAVTDMFMKNGISSVQANEIIKSYNELGKQQTAQMFDPKDFETTLEKAFGPEWKTVTGSVRNTIKGMMSADDQKALDNVPNAYLATIYRTLGNVVQKYGVKETDTAHFNGPGNAANTQDINVVREGIRKELASLPNRPHSATEKQALRQKLADTYTNDPRIQQQGA